MKRQICITLDELTHHTIQKKLYADKATKNIPIILMTGNAHLEQVFVGKNNVSAFITKPFTIKDVKEKIKDAAKGRHGKD